MANKTFVKRKIVLLPLAIASILAIAVTVTLFSRYVFDCVTVENSTRVTVNNSIKYNVHYDEILNDNAGEPLFDNPIRSMNDPFYLLSLTEYILIDNEVDIELSKELKFDYVYKVKTSFKIRQGNNSNSIITPQVRDLVEIKGSGESDKFALKLSEEPGGKLKIELAEYESIYENFKTLANLSAELAVSFEITINSDDFDKPLTVSRGMTIPIQHEAYAINLTGNATVEKDIPERQIRFPGIPITVGAAALLVALVAISVLSIREMTLDGDRFKRTVNRITRKHSNDVVMAATFPELKNDTVVEVKNFKELIKFSQNLCKPIVYTENHDSGLFYIICDNMVYQYEVKKDKLPETRIGPEVVHLGPQPEPKPEQETQPESKPEPQIAAPVLPKRSRKAVAEPVQPEPAVEQPVTEEPTEQFVEEPPAPAPAEEENIDEILKKWAPPKDE